MAGTLYDPEAYRSLPTLHRANQLLHEKGGENIVTGPIRDLFLHHGVQSQLGIALLHKHWDIQSQERLVDLRSVTTPWQTGDDRDAVIAKYNGHIVPRSMMSWNGTWAPYEFEFTEGGPSGLEEDSARFLQELSTFLRGNDLDRVLGVRMLESRESSLSVEVTEGRSNIMLAKGSVDEESLIPALWVFGKDEDDRCNCREYCYTSQGGAHTGSNHGCG